MKKMISLLLALLLGAACLISAFAEENNEEYAELPIPESIAAPAEREEESAAEAEEPALCSVPEPTYTLTVPENAEIPFGTEQIVLGQLTCTPGANFTEDTRVTVTVTHTDLTGNAGDSSIPYLLLCSDGSSSNSGAFQLIFSESTAMSYELTAEFRPGDWKTADGGSYSSVISYSSVAAD